jgi:hypothetical protein
MAKWDWSKLEWHGPLPDIRSLNSLEDIAFAVSRIEELETENKRLKSMVADVIADTGDDPEIMAASRAEWAARALAVEAKLAKATLALDEAIYLLDPDEEDIAKETGLHRIVTIRAELKGEPDGK